MLLVGDDWAEDHHDIEIEDDAGRRLARQRLPEGLAGISQLHALISSASTGRIIVRSPGTRRRLRRSS
jgi:hypothetical protein